MNEFERLLEEESIKGNLEKLLEDLEGEKKVDGSAGGHSVSDKSEESNAPKVDEEDYIGTTVEVEESVEELNAQIRKLLAEQDEEKSDSDEKKEDDKDEEKESDDKDDKPSEDDGEESDKKDDDDSDDDDDEDGSNEDDDEKSDDESEPEDDEEPVETNESVNFRLFRLQESLEAQFEINNDAAIEVVASKLDSKGVFDDIDMENKNKDENRANLDSGDMASQKEMPAPEITESKVAFALYKSGITDMTVNEAMGMIQEGTMAITTDFKVIDKNVLKYDVFVAESFVDERLILEGIGYYNDYMLDGLSEADMEFIIFNSGLINEMDVSSLKKGIRECRYYINESNIIYEDAVDRKTRNAQISNLDKNIERATNEKSIRSRFKKRKFEKMKTRLTDENAREDAAIVREKERKQQMAISRKKMAAAERKAARIGAIPTRKEEKQFLKAGAAARRKMRASDIINDTTGYYSDREKKKAKKHEDRYDKKATKAFSKLTNQQLKNDLSKKYKIEAPVAPPMSKSEAPVAPPMSKSDAKIIRKVDKSVEKIKAAKDKLSNGDSRLSDRQVRRLENKIEKQALKAKAQGTKVDDLKTLSGKGISTYKPKKDTTPESKTQPNTAENS